MPAKKQIKIDTDIKEIVVVNNKKLAPYIEIVNFSSRNIDQKKLGTVLGIFEIKDLSEDSAYIVNFLSSVAKKTYFASHQKNADESFESALAKVNLSLAEIANQGNVNWIGKIDAVMCSIFENQINFSVSGDAKVLLLRGGQLSEISANLSPKDEAVNPLKTFTDIASGKLEIGDKLILTTDDISHIFTLEDLEKNANSFSEKDFSQFLKTALINELDIAGTIVVDAKEHLAEKPQPINQKIPAQKKLDTDSTDINLFSNSAFTKEKSAPKNPPVQNPKPLPEKKEESKDYTNQQTGHIYISDSGENYSAPAENKFDEWLEISKEKMSDLGFWIKETYIRKINYKIKKQVSQYSQKIKSQPEPIEKPAPTPKAVPAPPKVQPTPIPKIVSAPPKIKPAPIRKNSSVLLQIKPEPIASPAKEKTILPPKIKNNSQKICQKIPPKVFPPLETRKPLGSFVNREKLSEKICAHKIAIKNQNHILKEKLLWLLDKIFTLLKKLAKNIWQLRHKIAPQISLAKRMFLKMNPKMRIISILILAFIFIAPFFFFGNNSQETITSEIKTDETSAQINPATEFHKDAAEILGEKNLIGFFALNSYKFAIGKNKIIDLDSQKEHPYPENFRDAKLYSFMSDLNMLFLLDDKNQIISFSPISLKFKEESIELNDDFKIEAIASYLTYLYLADSNNKQIYRYPRAEDGFGIRTNWLRDDISFDEITGMAIDGNVYLARKDSVSKLFNRKTEVFNLEKDSDSTINDIFTSDELSSIYILDNLNGEITKYNKDGQKESFFSNQELTGASKIWIDEKNSTAYFTTDSGLFRINF